MTRRKPEQRYEPPKIGDYIARQEPLKTGGYVALKVHALTDERRFACETMEGARRLAKLMNDVRDLARDWRDIRTVPLFKNGDPEKWARNIIAHALCEAAGVEAAHDFGASLLGDGEPPDELPVNYDCDPIPDQRMDAADVAAVAKTQGC